MQGSSGVNQRSNWELEMPCDYQIWWERLTKVQCIIGVKCNSGTSRGQQELKLIRNTLIPYGYQIWWEEYTNTLLGLKVIHCFTRGQVRLIYFKMLYAFQIAIGISLYCCKLYLNEITALLRLEKKVQDYYKQTSLSSVWFQLYLALPFNYIFHFNLLLLITKSLP